MDGANVIVGVNVAGTGLGVALGAGVGVSGGASVGVMVGVWVGVAHPANRLNTVIATIEKLLLNDNPRIFPSLAFISYAFT